MYFQFVNSQLINELYGFKMQIFKILFWEVKELTSNLLYLYNLILDTQTTLQVSVGFSFLGLLTRSI